MTRVLHSLCLNVSSLALSLALVTMLVKQETQVFLFAWFICWQFGHGLNFGFVILPINEYNKIKILVLNGTLEEEKRVRKTRISEREENGS